MLTATHVTGCASVAASVRTSCCMVQNELARNVRITRVTNPAVCMFLHTHSSPGLHVILGYQPTMRQDAKHSYVIRYGVGEVHAVNRAI